MFHFCLFLSHFFGSQFLKVVLLYIDILRVCYYLVVTFSGLLALLLLGLMQVEVIQLFFFFYFLFGYAASIHPIGLDCLHY